MHRMLPTLNHLALQTAATGTVADDVLGLPELVATVLAAIDDDDFEAVCKTAESWCLAFATLGLSCRNAHDTWRALATRVFPGAPTLDKDNAQANFYALCQRANEYRRGARFLNNNGDEDVRVFVMAAVKHHGGQLLRVNELFKRDPEIVLAAVTKKGTALRYADASLKREHNIVLAAVTQDGWALGFTDGALRGKHDIVLAAVTQNGDALVWASVFLKKDHEIVLAAVTRNGHALRYASELLKKDPDILLAAVTQDGMALRYADESLQSDLFIVLTAVVMDRNALQFADISLKKHPVIVKAVAAKL